MQCLLVVVTVTVVAVAVVLSIGPLIKFGTSDLFGRAASSGCSAVQIFVWRTESRQLLYYCHPPTRTDEIKRQPHRNPEWVDVFCCCFQRGAYQGDGSFAADES